MFAIFTHLTKEYVQTALDEERLWKPGESDTFSFGPWRLTMTRDEDWALPFKFLLEGSKFGTQETWSRRYISMEQAFLHVFNDFNENVNIKNRYASLDEALEIFWRQNTMKVCVSCGRSINEDAGEMAYVVNVGMESEFVQCEACHDSDMINGRVVSCEA